MTEQKQFVVSRKKLVNLMLEEHLVSSLKAGNHFNLTIADFGEALDRCRLPIQPPTRIEAAIRFLDEKGVGFSEGDTEQHKIATEVAIAMADFGRWCLCQESTWKDADLGLKEEKK